jgi:hypothetical protein
MKLIESKTLGTAQAAIEFTSIPSTFTDLVIVFGLRGASGSGGLDASLNINNSSTNFSVRRLFGRGDGTVGNTTSPATNVGLINGSDTTANTFSNCSIYIANYSGSNSKSISVDTVYETNATLAYQQISATLWNNSAAITSLKLLLDGSINLAAGSTASLYGIGGVGDGYAAPKATGGIISYTDGYIVHTFTASGTFTPTANLTDVEYLVVAGGGSGGNATGYNEGAGGGGAGGYRSSITGESSGGGASAESKLSLTSGTAYTVTVGAGGAGRTGYNNGNPGSNSVFSTVTSAGGGQGAVGSTGQPGGSGGGAGGDGGAIRNGGPGTANQGFIGGNVTGGNRGGGGGGGAAAQGQDVTTGGGNGGNGVTSLITGSSITRAGGGAGVSNGGSYGTGGSGGGGNSSILNGTVNTGSGGAGKITSGTSGAGGSGIVVVRYAA